MKETNPMKTKETKKTSKGDLASVVISTLRAEKMKYTVGEDPKIVYLALTSKDYTYQSVFDIRPESHVILFYMMGPMKVPADKRAMVSEYINRANYGLIVGNFELDMKDGEVRYKATLITEGTAPKIPTIKRLMYPVILTMHKYYPGLMDICFKGLSVEKAMAAVEKD